MKEKDSMLFPITDIYDLAETLANLSDDGLNTLKISLANDYGINLELNKKNNERVLCCVARKRNSQ